MLSLPISQLPICDQQINGFIPNKTKNKISEDIIESNSVQTVVDGSNSIGSSRSFKSLAEYKSEHVNSLLHIDQSRELQLDDQANECGVLLVQYALNDVLAISRLHSHYKLEDKERVVVTVQNSSSSRLGDGLEPNSSIIVKKPLQPQKQDVPYIFRFGTDGAIIPLEYISGDVLEKKLGVTVPNNLIKVADRVLNQNKFLTELFKLITKQGNIDTLGFQLIFEDEILTKLRKDDVLHEDNWHRYQEVTYRPLSHIQKSTVTSWRFAYDALKESRCYCQSRCVCSNWSQGGHDHIENGHNQYD
jgi:hypothetical protein